jgi:hypothetical protein
MKPSLIDHLRREWPLVLATAGLAIYLPVALLRGVFYTNQGSILRDRDPEAYWHWIRRFLVLLVAGLGVIIGSYYLA